MAATASAPAAVLLRAAWAELLPFEGRFGMAWRVAAQCMLAAAIFMTYGIPMAAIGCYLVLFIMKPDGLESTLMAIAISILVSLVVFMMVPLIRWTIEYPLWRMALIVGASLLFLYIGAASLLGPMANILALVVAFITTLLSDIPLGEVATRGLLYAWLMAVAPMGVVVLFNMFLGRTSLQLLRATLAGRLRAVASVLKGDTPPNALDAFLRPGNEELNKQAGLAKLLHLAPTVQTTFLRNAIGSSYRLMLAVSSPSGMAADPQARMGLAGQCETVAAAIEQGRPVLRTDTETAHDPDLADAQEAMAALSAGVALPQASHAKGKSFFFPDALSNPSYQYFAIRTTAAAVICYLIYTALDWQDIHTAMITCYVAALGSTAETVHKLFLRIIGCLIGAAMGMGSIQFLMPHMTSIGALMLLVFAGILVAGWVAAGSERISYAGIQIGLAFLLTVLQGFGPEVKMDVAWDRIIGILVGNFVMFIMFTRLWPVGIFGSVGPALTRVLERLAGLARPDAKTDPATTELAELMAELNHARESLRLLMFEPRRLHPVQADAESLRRAINKAEQVCHLVAFQRTRSTPEYRQAVGEIPELLRQVRLATAMTASPST